MVGLKKRNLTKKESKRLWLFTIWIVVIFFFTFMMLNLYGPRIYRESLLKVPIIKSALDDNPNIQINETFISKDNSSLAILTILEKCGEEIEEMDFVLVELEHNGTIIRAYFDPVTQEAICVYTELSGAGGSGGAGGAGGGDDGSGGAGGGDGGGSVACVSDGACDDGNPYTIDSCVNGFCQNSLMSCSAIGGVICTGSMACNTSTVTASDGACCLSVCVGDECQTDSDCDDSYASTMDTCEGVPKRCVNRLMTCPEMGYRICTPGYECSTSIVASASTGDCCPGTCLLSTCTTKCTTNADCPSNNPTVTRACVDGCCVTTHIEGICAGGDDICPYGCGIQNDTDCE